MDAIDEGLGTSTGLLGGEPYQLVSVPVEALGDLLGLIVAGFRIDNDVAFELERVTRSNVSFAAFGRVFATTLPEGARSVLEEHLLDLPFDETTVIGTEFLATIGIVDIAVVGVTGKTCWAAEIVIAGALANIDFGGV